MTAIPVEGVIVDNDHDGEPDVFKHGADLATAVDAEVVERPDAEPVHAGTPLDGELMDDSLPVPVDQPDFVREGIPAMLEARAAKRRPMVAPWVRDAGELKQVMRWAAGHVLHVTGFHTLRTPLYGAKLATRSPLGLARVVGATFGWAFATEHAPLRHSAVKRDDVSEYEKLERIRDKQVKRRLPVAGVAALVVIVGLWVTWAVAPWWVVFLVNGTVMGTLGAFGGRQDKPLVSPAVVAFKFQKLTSEVVIRALGSLGIGEINKALNKKVGEPGITFPAPITRDGPGWRADVDLPYGVTVTDILERREALASGLRRPLGCVWPETDPLQHAGRMILWVGDTDLRQSRQAAWPLLKSGSVDLFKPIPFGTDQRGRPVGLDLMFQNLLLGAMPRQGKTAALRVALLAAALDANAQLRVFELKGTGDLSPLEPVCHHYASGADDEAIEATLNSLRDLYAEMVPRAARLSELAKRDRALVPDNKVTPELSGRRSLGLFPIVMGIDEAQELFTHPEYGKEAANLCTAIIKRGPAAGIILLLATQRPDKESLPKGISANVALRFCLYVSGQVENDMVLGTSKYQQGIRATVFTPLLDAGIGYLVGSGPAAVVTRTYYVNGPQAEKVVERARGLREAAGTLTGHAVGDAQRPGQKVSLIDDIATVFGGAEKLWTEQIAGLLAEYRPDFYEGLTSQQLGAMLRNQYRIETEQIWQKAPADGGSQNRQGLKRNTLMAAVERKWELEK